MKMTAFAMIPILALSTAACDDKEGAGMLLGAIGGAVIGNEIGGHGTGQVIAIAAGTLAGAYIGSEIGASLDRADRQAMQQTTQYALEDSPSHQTSEWVNPDSGNRGTITPRPSYEEDGRYCREYQQTVTIAGKTEQMYGTACRQPDGSWQVVSD